MKSTCIIILSFIVCAVCFAAPELPAKEKFHIFLLAGQSNMAGRGAIEAEDKIPHPRVLMLTEDGKWTPAAAPVHYDKKQSGVGLSRSFAITIAEKDPDITIGLVPAACGGSPISSWQPGVFWRQTKSNPYDDAVKRAKRALQDGILKGILWHQGESESQDPELAKAYETNLRCVIARFRKDLSAPDTPFIIGQMGQFPERPWPAEKKQVDAAQQRVAQSDKRAAFVSSDDLTSKKDLIHFDTPSLRELGRRYAAAYEDLKQDTPAVQAGLPAHSTSVR